MKIDKNPLGLIYPLPHEIAERLFKENRNIVLKYLTWDPKVKTKSKLSENIKLFIYASNSKKEVIGEGIIFKIDYLTKEEIDENMYEKLILKKNELEKYSYGRTNKKMAVIYLKNILLYETPKKTSFPVTMTGKYIYSMGELKW